MTETTKDKKPTTEKDFVTRLADAGEEALHRLADLPGGQKALTAVNDLRARVDDLAKKVRGIDALEAREGARGAEEGRGAGPPPGTA